MLYKEYLQNRKQYQEDGVMLLLKRKHACLFYKPGKGKTYPTIEALREVAMDKKVLILSTADAIRNMWEVEILPQNILPKDTTLMTFSSAVRDDKAQWLLKQPWYAIVVDECHKLKAHNTQISKLCYRLTKNAKYVFGLTGTPRGNSDIDIFCQFHNMNIDQWGEISYTQFCERLCDFKMEFFGGRTIKKPIGINHRYQAGFDKNVELNSQRETYGDEDNMPPLNFNIHRLPFVEDEHYKRAKKGVLAIEDYKTTFVKVVAILKMQQIANGYVYTTDELNGTRITQRIRENDKVEWVKANIDDKPTLIVYRFEYDLITLKKAFPSATENIDDFKQGKSKILLLQCSRCESFNLQMCRRIIFYTLDYSYITFNQMCHRVWRMGQTGEVNIDILLYKNSVEEQIWHAVDTKQTAAELFMSVKNN